MSRSYVPKVTPDAVVWVPADELTIEERSVLASHINVAVGALGLRGTERLADFEGIVIHGDRLATRLDDLEWLDDEGWFSEIDVFYLELPE